MGVWLPFALADLESLLFSIIRMFASKDSPVTVPSRAEILRGWCLPFLSEAVQADATSAAAHEEFERVKALGEKLKAKGVDVKISSSDRD